MRGRGVLTVTALAPCAPDPPMPTPPRFLAGPTEWTSWFNIDHPGGNGDYERLEAIRFYYRERVCTRPVAMEARTTDWVAAGDTGEVVHSSLEKGFWCINKEQPYGRLCSNYHVRFQCPPGSTLLLKQTAQARFWHSWWLADQFRPAPSSTCFDQLELRMFLNSW